MFSILFHFLYVYLYISVFCQILVNKVVRRYQLLYNGSLIINTVHAEDAGIYKCVGYTDSGPVQTFAVQLVLACKFITSGTVLLLRYLFHC